MDSDNLDALLDLAEKAPEQLQSIKVKDAGHKSGLGPETVFNPEKSSGSQATSTGGLLSNALGVVVRSTSALNQDVRIRGYSGSQLVGVADGMNQSKTRLDVDSLFSQIDPSLVESVTMIPGPYSVEYGPGFAFFDAELISPKRADFMTLTSQSMFGYTTNGEQLVWRETAGYADQSSGAIVSFGQRMGNDYRPGRHAPDFDVPSSYHAQDVFLATSNDVTRSSRLNVTYLRQELRDTELPGVAYDINHQHADQFNVRWSAQDTDDIDRVLLQFWWNQAIFDVDASRPSKQQTFGRRFLGEPYYELEGGGTIVGNGFSDNWGARTLFNFGDPGEVQLRTGFDWRRIRQRYQEEDVMADGTLALLGDTFGIPKSASDDFGIFAGGSIPITDAWSIGAGQRVDWVLYDVSSNDLVSASVQYTPDGVFPPGYDTSTRLLSTTYLTSSIQATENVSINGGVAFAMRPPNLTELYADQPFAPVVRFGNSFVMGDSTIDPERNLQFDLGLTGKRERTTYGVRGFYSCIQDYIGLAATNYASFPEIGTTIPGRLGRGHDYNTDPELPNQDINADSGSLGYQYRNIDLVTIYGFDLMAEHQIEPWLELGGTLTYTRATNHDPTWVDVYTGEVHPLPTNESLPGIYPLSGNVFLRLVEPIDRKWSVEWQSRCATHQNYLAGSLGEVGTPGFMVHNIHASYKWSDRLSFRTSLLNVFDRNYYEHNSLAIVDRFGNVGFVKNPGLGWFSSVEYRF